MSLTVDFIDYMTYESATLWVTVYVERSRCLEKLTPLIVELIAGTSHATVERLTDNWVPVEDDICGVSDSVSLEPLIHLAFVFGRPLGRDDDVVQMHCQSRGERGLAAVVYTLKNYDHLSSVMASPCEHRHHRQ